MKTLLNCWLITLSFALCGHADVWTVSLLPGTAISGPAGSTIGWGYDITNESATQWLVLENVAETPFQDVVSLDPVFDYPILAPGGTASEDYVPGTTGLLGLTWSSSAAPYYVNAGNFVLSADWYSGDPFGTGVDLGAAPQETVAYSAQVSPTAPTAVPEPAALGFVVVLAVFVSWRLRGGRNTA
jgi:hypothetical protein